MNELFDQIRLIEEYADVQDDHYLQLRIERVKQAALKLLDVREHITIRPN